MTRTIEMETKFEGDWTYEIRFEADKIWIDTGCSTISMCYEDFDRIVAEREKYARLSQQVQEAA